MSLRNQLDLGELWHFGKITVLVTFLLILNFLPSLWNWLDLHFVHTFVDNLISMIRKSTVRLIYTCCWKKKRKKKLFLFIDYFDIPFDFVISSEMTFTFGNCNSQSFFWWWNNRFFFSVLNINHVRSRGVQWISYCWNVWNDENFNEIPWQMWTSFTPHENPLWTQTSASDWRNKKKSTTNHHEARWER